MSQVKAVLPKSATMSGSLLIAFLFGGLALSNAASIAVKTNKQGDGTASEWTTKEISEDQFNEISNTFNDIFTSVENILPDVFDLAPRGPPSWGPLGLWGGPSLWDFPRFGDHFHRHGGHRHHHHEDPFTSLGDHLNHLSTLGDKIKKLHDHLESVAKTIEAPAEPAKIEGPPESAQPEEATESVQPEEATESEKPDEATESDNLEVQGELEHSESEKPTEQPEGDDQPEATQDS